MEWHFTVIRRERVRNALSILWKIMLVITPDQDGADVLRWFFKDVKPEVNCMMQKRLLEHIKKNDDMQMKRLKLTCLLSGSPAHAAATMRSTATLKRSSRSLSDTCSLW